MSEAHTAKDPYCGLNRHFSRRAQGEIPSWYAIGQVLSVQPLKVRADGMDLDRTDLKVAGSLLSGWTEQLSGLSCPVSSQLPEKKLTGTCKVTVNGVVCAGTAEVTRPAETVSGKTGAAASATHGIRLKAGDEVLLLRSADGQTYYLVERMVSL